MTWSLQDATADRKCEGVEVNVTDNMYPRRNSESFTDTENYTVNNRLTLTEGLFMKKTFRFLILDFSAGVEQATKD